MKQPEPADRAEPVMVEASPPSSLELCRIVAEDVHGLTHKRTLALAANLQRAFAAKDVRIAKLEAVLRRTYREHATYCETPEGCSCGADTVNALIDSVLSERSGQ